MTPDGDYAMGMAQVLATLAVAVAVIARRTSTRAFQSAQRVLHFALGTFGLAILVMDIMVASSLMVELPGNLLERLNLGAAGSLILLVYALAPFFQTTGEANLEKEARQIIKDREAARRESEEPNRPKESLKAPPAKRSGRQRKRRR